MASSPTTPISAARQRAAEMGVVGDDAMHLGTREVHGVISYYPHFRSTPAGRHVLQVCRAEACQSRGADALLAHAGQALGCGSSGHGHEHGTSADGAVTLEQIGRAHV